MTLDHPSLRPIEFALNDLFILPNLTQVRSLEAQTSTCLDQITQNQTDILPNWTPLTTYAPHFMFFTITDQSSSVIISSYNPNLSTSETGVLSTFTEYSIDVALLSLMLVTCFMTLFRTHSAVYARYQRWQTSLLHGSSWRTFGGERKAIGYWDLLLGLLLLQYSSRCCMDGSSLKSFSFKLLFMTSVCFTAMQHFYFSSFIKTELVTVEKARIITSIDEVLEIPSMMGRWITYDSDYKNYKNAPPESVMNKLWLRSQPDAMVSPSPSLAGGVKHLMDEICHGEAVAIGHWVTMGIMHAAMCPIGRFLELTAKIIKRLTPGHQIPMASVYNDRMDKDIVKSLAKRVTASAEFDIMGHLLSQFESPVDIGMVRKEDVTACQQDQVQQDQTDVLVRPKIREDFDSLLILCCVLVTLSFLLFLCEKYRVSQVKRSLVQQTPRVHFWPKLRFVFVTLCSKAGGFIARRLNKRVKPNPSNSNHPES